MFTPVTLKLIKIQVEICRLVCQQMTIVLKKKT